MTDIQRSVPLTLHQPHTLISWNAVFAGAAVAVAVGAMLNLLGMALGAAALDPYDLTRGEAEGFTVGAGIWIAIANALALFVGGLIASRAAKHSDHHKGFLNGLVVWAVAFLFAIVVATATASGTMASTAGGAAEAAPEAAALANSALPGTPTGAPDVATYAAPAPLPALPMPGEPAPTREAADDAAEAASAASLWGFLTMLLGAIAAALGGRYGIRKHQWELKAGIGDPVDAAMSNKA